jgi:hypothetical protein
LVRAAASQTQVHVIERHVIERLGLSFIKRIFRPRGTQAKEGEAEEEKEKIEEDSTEAEADTQTEL